MMSLIGIFITIPGEMKKNHNYVVWIQYLGFRYSGWQKQPGQKTLEGMIRKTIRFIRPEMSFKILGAGRTDAKVSALKMAFQLFSKDGPIENIPVFLDNLNNNLPSDIRALEMFSAQEDFNIIQDAKIKEYQYLFSFGAKNHPFCAPFMANFPHPLDLSKMKEAAGLFKGTHSFHNFTARIQPNTKVSRTVEECVIKENSEITASFFPEESYVLHVKGSGFMRYQIRMMMGALVLVGKGDMEESTLQRALLANEKITLPFIAPGSGLSLRNIEFK
jgi:tRNA pseudouridine38-40 synthase